jgi:hypothetical protein
MIQEEILTGRNKMMDLVLTQITSMFHATRFFAATSYRNTMTHRLQDTTVTSRSQEISYVTIGGPQFNKMSGSMLKDVRLASKPNPIDSLLKLCFTLSNHHHKPGI